MLLTRAYWLEKQQEQSDQWLAYLSVKNEESKNVLFKISIDSEKHKTMLKNIISNIKDFDLNESLKEYSLDEKHLNINRREDKEIFSEILKNEHLALDLYSKLHKLTDKTLINESWLGKKPEEYFENLAWLIEQEKEHVNLVESLSPGEIERIL
jgi:hypothetical protein